MHGYPKKMKLMGRKDVYNKLYLLAEGTNSFPVAFMASAGENA